MWGRYKESVKVKTGFCTDSSDSVNQVLTQTQQRQRLPSGGSQIKPTLRNIFPWILWHFRFKVSSNDFLFQGHITRRSTTNRGERLLTKAQGSPAPSLRNKVSESGPLCSRPPCPTPKMGCGPPVYLAECPKTELMISQKRATTEDSAK